MPAKTNSFSPTTLLILLLAVAFISWPAAAPAQARGSLFPGLYQSQDASASCRLSAMPDGSMLMMLWQGGARQAGQRGGFSFSGRLVAGTGGRLAGAFQALPGTCCPVSGRIELQASGPDAFNIVYFVPSPWRTVVAADAGHAIQPGCRAGPGQPLATAFRRLAHDLLVHRPSTRRGPPPTRFPGPCPWRSTEKA